MAKKKKPGFWERYAKRKLSEISSAQQENDLFLLSEEEIDQLRKIRNATYWKAGLAGTLGVLLLYLPYHLFGATLFPETSVWIPIYNEYIPLEIEFLVYSLILVFAEILYLTYVNVNAVSEIAHACGHPNPTDANFDKNVDALIAVGLDKKQNELASIGINPYEGLHPWSVMVFQFMLRLKATVSGIVFKFLIKGLLGRYALRAVLDFAGIPVYAFWNIWGARKIMNETRIRVMAPPLIRRCVDLIYEEQKENPSFKDHLYDTLQLISESKRAFHFNHFLLSIALLEKFEVEIVDKPPYNKHFLNDIPELSEQSRIGVQKLFVFGIMIDGRLTYREKKAIRYLIDKKVLSYREDEIRQWVDDYYDGKGIDHFFLPE